MDDKYFESLFRSTDFSHTTTAAYPSSGPLTYEAIKAAIDALPPEPIGEYMRERGCPPEDGWLLFLPASMRDDALPFPPAYVRFSALIAKPVMFPTHLLHY
jgi:hypothetical protein